jgi:conjugal transfer/entry exclusion protein
MSEPTIRNLSRLPRRRKVFVFLIVGLLVTGTPTLVAGFGDIIFDPTNFAKNVQQVVALLRQIQQAGEQIRQQRLMLAHVQASVSDALALAGQSLHGRLTEGTAGSIEPQYPIDFPTTTPGWLDVKRTEWNALQRQQLLHERNVVQHVHDQMLPTQTRLAVLIEASNGVDAAHGKPPGQVAVAQAHEELLALYSGEVDKLLAIRALRASRHADRQAHHQSEEAYHQARRHDLMSDWTTDSTEQPRPVSNPF